MAVNNKQYLIPGVGFLDSKNEDEQWLMPGYGFIDEESEVGGAADIRRHIISAYMRINK
jgi:hypothetical protein